MMEAIKTVIIDDEALGRKIIREYLEFHPDVQIVAECKDAHEALKAIDAHHPDLLFLDIQMPEVDGFELLSMLDEIPYVIFSTAYDEYALWAFEVNAVDYLLKPIVQDRFDGALDRVRRAIRKSESLDRIEKLVHGMARTDAYPERFLVKETGKIIIVLVEEILWIEAMEDYVNLYTEKGVYTIHQTMASLEERLNPVSFIRVHRSRIVNLDGVKEIQSWTDGRMKCHMKDGQEIVTSRAGAKRVKKMMV